MTDGGDRRGLRVFVVFYASLMAICGELCLALMLGLKAYSHMVYVVLSFALLGYGLGSNLFLVLRRRLDPVPVGRLSALSLASVSALTAAAAHLLPHLRITLDLIYSGRMVLSLAMVYATVALPFVGIGFLITLLFSAHAAESRRLYFWDLVGAGLGAVAFFPLIAWAGPLNSLVLLSVTALVPALWCVGVDTPARRAAAGGLLALAIAESATFWAPEPEYRVDQQIGWEWIPGKFPPDQYENVLRTWHPLGRTDLHRMKGIEARRWLVTEGNPITFEIPVDPLPEFCYFTNSYRAGTPVYALSEEGLRKQGSRIVPFATVIETPYVLLERPRVLVIGAGGGRDLFVARIHRAAEVVGAEINPGTYAAMSPGGVAFDYSGRVYTAGGTVVHNIDGRHLVKNRPPGSHDLVVLNGVDTFAALSTGAYAFAENYLYTSEALLDYLRVLSDGGVINFNRWFESLDQPRETLRLLMMSFDALRALGVQDPTRHVVVARCGGWGVVLIKRTPFTESEERRLLDYFAGHRLTPVYVPGLAGAVPANRFEEAAAAVRGGQEKEFIRNYWADVSVVTDDNPFFYKYYKFQLTFTPDRRLQHPGAGLTAFHVQAVIIVQTIVFILVFIFLPLWVTKRKGSPVLPAGMRVPFVAYFAALGTGFIFIEITLMQRFTLALGSPITSISVTLATLLVTTGAGSLLSEWLRGRNVPEVRIIRCMSVFVAGYCLAMVLLGTTLLNALVEMPAALRIALSVLALAPVGLGLGVFFPAGLVRVSGHSPDAVAWAWGINSGFTVLGSTVTILIAQFLGFSVVLLIAGAFYLTVPLTFGKMEVSRP